jgi:hypothetical protein
MSKGKYLFIILFLLLLVSPVAAKTYTQNTNVTYTLGCSELINCNATQYNLTLISPEGIVLVNNEPTTISNSYISYNLNTTQTSSNGNYFIYVLGDDGYTAEDTFLITPTGTILSSGVSIGYGLLMIMVFLSMVLLFIGALKTDELQDRIGFFAFSYILAIPLLFISWRLANNYLYTTPFLPEILYFLWILSMILFFPFILGMVIYLYLKVFNQNSMDNLMDIGYTEGEAKQRLNKK